MQARWFDSVSRQTSTKYPDGTRVTLAYDLNSNRTKLHDSSGRYSFVYDVLDRVSSSRNPLSKSLTYSYDAVGNRRSLAAPDSGRFSYVYDAADQLSALQNPFSERTTFSYDNAGRRTVQRSSNGTRASIIYDDANHVTQFHNRTSTGTALATFDYKYDNVGNRTGMLEASGDRLTWTYDNGDQLKSERRSGASSYTNTFTYDAVGNRNLKNDGTTRTTFSYDVADQLVYSQTPAGRTTNVYDSAGNQQIERPPARSRTTTVWYNENRPVLCRLPDTTRVTMSYNAGNRRVSKESSTETVKFVWDTSTDAYLAEFDGANTLQATYTQEPVQFGRAISQPRSSPSNWYHTDALGSIRALSNSSQVTSDTYLYDAWGNPLSSTGTTVNPFRWVGNVGYYFDSVTGLQYIRARTYQPTIARWTSVDPLFYMLAKAGMIGLASRDPMGFVGGLHIYAYVLLRPLSTLDPLGLIPPDHTNPRKDTHSRWPYTPGGPLGPQLPPRAFPLNPFDCLRSTLYSMCSTCCKSQECECDSDAFAITNALNNEWNTNYNRGPMANPGWDVWWGQHINY